MIVTVDLGCDMEVSLESLRIPGVEEAAYSRMIKQLIGHAEDGGWYVRPESVRIRILKEDSTRMVRLYQARWYPLPGNGVLLEGGPWDGEVRAINSKDALEIVTFLPPQPGDTWASRTGHERPRLSNAPTYRRLGKDPQRDCWVYGFVS